MEEARQRLEQEKEELFQKNQELERYKEDIKKLKNSLNSSKDKEMEIAQEQAKKLIRDVQYQAAQMLEELETLKKQKDKEDFSQKVSISALSNKR